MKKFLLLLLAITVAFSTAVFATGQQEGLKAAFTLQSAQGSSKMAFKVSDPSQLIGGPAASGRVGDYMLKNSSISVLIGSLKNYHGYMKGGGNILDVALTGQNNDLFDEAHTYFSWPKQAIYEKIIIKDDGEQSGNGIIEVVGHKSDMPAIKIDTTYTLASGSNYVVIRTTLTNTSDKDAGPMILGDVTFFGYARSFLYGNGFSFKKFDSPLIAGTGDDISYGVTTTQNNPETGKMLPVHISYIYTDPEIVPKAVIKAGKSVSYEREFIAAPTLADVEKTVFDLRSIPYSTLKGQAVDIFGNTVPFAKIVAKDSTGLTVSESRTNAAGEYAFYLENGEYTLNIEQPGYTTKPLTVKAETDKHLPILKVGYVTQNKSVWPTYLTNVSKDSVYVNLKTLLPSVVTVKYEKSNNYNANNKFTNSITENTANIYHHINLTGLEPNTKYTYTIVSTDPVTGTYSGKISSFVTAPVNAAELKDFSFVVYGDTRTFQLRNKTVCDSIVKDPADPRFVFNIGDLTMDGRVMAEWNQFFGAIANLASRVPYYPILGNHEYNSSYFYNAFPLPKGGGTGQEEWYSFNYGSIHFIVLDADVILMEKDAEKMQKQTAWLTKDLEANNNAKFKVVLFHQPFWTNTISETGNPDLIKYWKNIFEKYRVNVVFNGHYHAYEHFYENGVNYITTAGGGAPMYKLKPRDKWWAVTKKAITDIHHYILVDVKGDTMTLTVKGVLKQLNDKDENAVEPDNEILDKVIIKSTY